MEKLFIPFLKDETGAAAAEYALILAIVTVGIVAAVGVLGTAISTSLTNAAAWISVSAP